jgi:hypothetical protein
VWFEYMATLSAMENDMTPEKSQEREDGLRAWAKLIPLVTVEWVKERNLLGLPRDLW